MSRFRSRVGWALAVLVVVVIMAQVAEAQRGEGRGRGRGGRGFFGGPIPSVQLAAESDDVQVALNVTAQQQEQIEAINDKLRDDRREVIDRRDRDWRAALEQMEKLNREASAKLAEVLSEEQQKRLLGISIQVNGATALSEPAVAKELNITDEQKEKLDEARATSMRSSGEAFRELRNLSGEERRAKLEELRAERDKNLLAVLTSEQQAQYEALKGEPVEVDMSEFRGGGRGGRGGEGRRGGGRERGRNRADRDSDAGSSDSN